MLDPISSNHSPVSINPCQASSSDNVNVPPVISIYNIPEETFIYNKLKLSPADYQNLRVTCKYFHQLLPNLNVIHERMKENFYRGELKSAYLTLLASKAEEEVRHVMKAAAKKDVLHGLKNSFATRNEAENYTLAGADYYLYFDQNNILHDSVHKNIDILRVKIDQNLLIGNSRINSPYCPTPSLNRFSIILSDEYITLSKLTEILSAAKELYSHTEGIERLIFASLANQLYKTWGKNPPNNLKAEDAQDIFAQYTYFFLIGEMAKKLAPERLREIDDAEQTKC